MSLPSRLHQSPCIPGSCINFILNLHWGRAATGKKYLASTHAGSLQLCPIICDPVNRGLPGFSVRKGGSPSKNTGVYWQTLVPIHFSVQFSHSIIFDSLQPHGLQNARPTCPSPASGIYSTSCPLSQWSHPTISFSAVSFSSRFQSFPASGSFQMNQSFTSGGQSIGVSASTSVFPVNTQDWSPSGWLVGSPCSPRDSQESSPTPQFKSINSSLLSLYSNSHIYTWLLGKT